MSAQRLYVLENELWQVGILPDTGASLAFGRIRHHTRWIDFLRPTPESKYDNASACASYVLVPWSNRIRAGRFSFSGRQYELRPNADDGTAIHGVGKNYPWQVDHASKSELFASYDSRGVSGVNFPFQFSSRMELRLDGASFSIRLSLRNEDTTSMPAGFGHHPYFQRTFSGPSDVVAVEIPCSQYFELDRAIPSRPAVPVEPRVDFRHLRPLGSHFIDDCLTGRAKDNPIRFVYADSGREISLHFDEIFQNVVVYVPREKDYFAVEPVTNANDGFNLHDRGIPGSGVFVLEPGQQREGTFTLEVQV
jgi:aldose 1-epimerase